MLEPVKKKRLYEVIVEQLIELINKGELKPGDRLPSENKLAETFFVSRTSVREALQALENIGYIHSQLKS